MMDRQNALSERRRANRRRSVLRQSARRQTQNPTGSEDESAPSIPATAAEQAPHGCRTALRSEQSAAERRKPVAAGRENTPSHHRDTPCRTMCISSYGRRCHLLRQSKVHHSKISGPTLRENAVTTGRVTA